MSRRYQEQFFAGAKTQSRIKLRVYEGFLLPWSQKLGSRNKQIWVVDGFAGPGRYASGEPGSPLIALQRATNIASTEKFRLRCIFGDTLPANQRSLHSLKGRHPAAGAMILERSFWSSIPDVLSIVQEDPALVFVDPYGLAGINFEKLKELVEGLLRVDLIVNFRSPVAPRLAPNLSGRLTQAVGSDDWTVGTISEVFRRNLERAGRFLAPATLAVRERLGGSVRSELVLASRHPDAYELWNDRIVLEVEALATAAGEEKPDRNAEIEEVQSRLAVWGEGRLRWHRPEAVAWHCTTYCGEAHTGTIKRAVDELVRRGVWHRQNAAPQIDRDWFLPGQRYLLPDPSG